MAVIGLVYWGSVDAASDQTMASIVNTPGTMTRAAIIALIAPVAAEIIANDSTIIEAAQAAVDAALADEQILLGTELSAVRTLDVVDELYAEVRLSYDFRRLGGSLRAGGEVGINPGSAESALAEGNAIVLLTRDYRRARAETADGWPSDGDVTQAGLFTDLASWGDSMTANRPTVGVSVAEEVARELSVVGYNGGVPSDTPTQIAWRFGGIPVTVDLGSSAGALPASGQIPVTVDPAVGWSNAARAWPCVVHDRNGQPVPVTLRQTAAAPSAVPTWTLEQSGGSATARTIYSGTRIAHTETLDRAMTQAPAIVWMGRNDLDLTRGEHAMRGILGEIRNAGQRLLVRPVFPQIDEPAGSPDRAIVDAYNDMLLSIVGPGRWLDSLRMLIDHGLEVAGITPTPADLVAISEDRIPPSLMADTTHLNAAGILAQSRLDANEIKARNW